MSDLTYDEVVAVVHPIDEATVAEIIATGITPDELARACAWVVQDEPASAGRELPPGRIGEVVEILERVKAEGQSGSILGRAGSTLE